MEKESKAKEDETFVHNQGRDALVETLRKLDHYVHAKGIGGIDVGIKNSFGKKDKKYQKSKSSGGLNSHEEL